MSTDAKPKRFRIDFEVRLDGTPLLIFDTEADTPGQIVTACREVIRLWAQDPKRQRTGTLVPGTDSKPATFVERAGGQDDA
jgi:hypothetical protein